MLNAGVGGHLLNAEDKKPKLAQLLMQLRFASPKHRRKQFDAAAKLLSIIDPDKEYPFDFVCFRITGFLPKAAEHQLIKGDELADDLQVFVSKLSSRLAVPASLQNEKVYSVDDLANRLNISRKTIDRWRKRGLCPANLSSMTASDAWVFCSQ